MHVRIINPNTSSPMTQDALMAGRAAAAPGTTVSARHPVTGASSIESHVDEVAGQLGVIEVLRRSEHDDVDAYVIACFGDTGLAAARDLVEAPVVGMTEAALMSAALVAHRFSVVTLPARTIEMSERVVASLGLSHRCTIRAIDVPVSSLEDELAVVGPLLAAAIEETIRIDGAEAVVLGCAGLSPLVESLRRQFGLPVIDGVAAGVGFAESLVRQGLRSSGLGTHARATVPPALLGLLSEEPR